ncbi:MAG: FAD-binding protein [Myxococcales bacterium]|nr:FAD-binding protein [Myxococcales bacterium]
MFDIAALLRRILGDLDPLSGATTVVEAVEYTLRYPQEFVTAVVAHYRGGGTTAPVDADALLRRFGSDDVGVQRRTWQNALGNQVVEPLELHTPRLLVDLVGIVGRAAAAGVKVKAVGSGGSFSDILQTTGILVDTTALSDVLPLEAGLLRPGADPATLFRVEAGIKIHVLNDKLWDAGLALPNMGGYAGQALAGAVAPATHGSGLALPPIADFVVSLDLVAADGTVYRIEPAGGVTDPAAFAAAHPNIVLKQDDDWFRSVVVGIGAMGLVYSLTLRVVPRYWLAERRYLSTWSDVKQALVAGTPLAAHRHYEVLVNPHPTDGDHTCLVTERNLAPEPTEPALLRPHRQLFPALVSASRLTEEVLVAFLNRFPAFTPALIDAALATLVDGDEDGPYVDRSYRVLDLGPVNRQKVYSGEVAFPLTTYLAAVDRALELAKTARDFGDVYQIAPFALRFVAASQHYLAMQHGGPRCMIEMPILDGMQGGYELLARFEAAAAALEGRPHWGELQEVSAAGGGLAALYPEAPRALAVRQLLDPTGMFDNTFTARAGL